MTGGPDNPTKKSSLVGEDKSIAAIGNREPLATALVSRPNCDRLGRRELVHPELDQPYASSMNVVAITTA